MPFNPFPTMAGDMQTSSPIFNPVDDTQIFSPGQIIEIEITHFIQNFLTESDTPTVLLFPPDIPPNMKSAIKYIALLFNMTTLFLQDGMLAVVRQQHLRLPYRNTTDPNIDRNHVQAKLHDTLMSAYARLIMNGQSHIQTLHMCHSAIGGGYPMDAWYFCGGRRNSKLRCFCGNSCTYQFTTLEKQLADPEDSSSSETDVENLVESKLNPLAEEFVPASMFMSATPKPHIRKRYHLNCPSRIVINDFVAKINCVSFWLEESREIEEYVKDGATMVLAGQNFAPFISPRYNMNYIVELYNISPTQKTNYIRNIYSERPLYIKWCDDTSALLVLRSETQAVRMLRIRHKQIGIRPFSNASPLAVVIAYYCNLQPAHWNNTL
ncbi:uncharacterized protein LOC116166596 isoform X2 [Photinus pyralis]|uniref:uncharacterized protein LOC116166596 isoform X2 n=1 Tax=Photinus pyralis TaxID=7054 RepID=UPI0012676A5B|nr:uncharacterized protein LOC116166596 isoform X2 [Photinus pyralis]